MYLVENRNLCLTGLSIDTVSFEINLHLSTHTVSLSQIEPPQATRIRKTVVSHRDSCPRFWLRRPSKTNTTYSKVVCSHARNTRWESDLAFREGGSTYHFLMFLAWDVMFGTHLSFSAHPVAPELVSISKSCIVADTDVWDKTWDASNVLKRVSISAISSQMVHRCIRVMILDSAGWTRRRSKRVRCSQRSIKLRIYHRSITRIMQILFKCTPSLCTLELWTLIREEQKWRGQ